MSSGNQHTVAITGANGYVGRTLSSAFTAAGYRVIALQRSSPAPGVADDSDRYLPYSLEAGPGARLPAGLSAVVHCAYDLRARRPHDIERINLGGCERLMKAVGDVPVVHISSMSAYPGTGQIYGRTKLACEGIVAARGGTSLRLGLVYGGMDGGMIGALGRVAALPAVPVLWPDSYQYTVHAEDMAQCVIASVADIPPHRVVGVANPRRVPFSEILGALRTRRPQRAVGVPVPSAAVYRTLRAAEAAGVKIGFRADSLLGLMHPAGEVPHVDYWGMRGIRLRDFADSSRPGG